jgi:hypothetical protein
MTVPLAPLAPWAVRNLGNLGENLRHYCLDACNSDFPELDYEAMDF